jgi:hypothetical protein
MHSLVQKLPAWIAATALVCAATTASNAAENVVFHADFSDYPVGTPGEQITDFYVWSELPHPLNPTIAEVRGDRTLVLNSALAYQSKGGSTVMGTKKYGEIVDTASAYANVTFEKPYMSSVGLSIILNRGFSPYMRLDAVLHPTNDGVLSLRLDSILTESNIGTSIVPGKAMPQVRLSAPIALGLHYSALDGTVSVTINRELVAEGKLPANQLAELPRNANLGIFAFNGQAMLFDDITLILGEPMPAAGE